MCVCVTVYILVCVYMCVCFSVCVCGKWTKGFGYPFEIP